MVLEDVTEYEQTPEGKKVGAAAAPRLFVPLPTAACAAASRLTPPG